jgi:hypothetical protein
MVARRHVFFLAGYDPYDLRAQHARFKREAAKFQNTWGVSAEISDIGAATGEAGERWHMTTRGPNWITSTIYEPLDWHDVVEMDLARPALPRLFNGFVAFLDFVVSGTAFRYFTASWRYGLFFLMPFVNLLLFAVLGIAAGVALACYLNAGTPMSAIVILAVAIVVFSLLRRWPGQKWRIDQALADWIFARDFMYGRRVDVDARLDGFASRVVAAAQRKDADEILIIGHSLGATMAVEVIARALAQDSEFANHGPEISLLTVGATIPKLALHPSASRLREGMARIVKEPKIFWTEYQARRDPISFYKYDPFALRAFEDNAAGRMPWVRLVGMKDMLTEQTFRRHKLNHMRLHYQFVMANERRASYDFFMLLAGPAHFSEVSLHPLGVLDLYGADGSYPAQKASQ